MRSNSYDLTRPLRHTKISGIPQLLLLATIVCAVGLPSHAYAAGKRATTGSKLVGKASWYGPGFHGKRTASGQRFNQNAMTAAHRSLPIGSKARVTNLRNGRSVEVTINDRGPHTGGRVIDLSRAAARHIAMGGTATVQIVALPN